MNKTKLLQRLEKLEQIKAPPVALWVVENGIIHGGAFNGQRVEDVPIKSTDTIINLLWA